MPDWTDEDLNVSPERSQDNPEGLGEALLRDSERQPDAQGEKSSLTTANQPATEPAQLAWSYAFGGGINMEEVRSWTSMFDLPQAPLPQDFSPPAEAPAWSPPEPPSWIPPENRPDSQSPWPPVNQNSDAPAWVPPETGRPEVSERYEQPGSPGSFAGLKNAIARAQQGGRPVSVLHYGDSQVVPGIQQQVIEGDLERRAPVTYTTKAKVGITANYPLQHTSDWLDGPIRETNPDLVIVSFGGNESAARVNPESYAAKYEQLILEIMNRAPNATIMLVGPGDGCSIVGANKGNLLPGLDQVIAVQKQIAAKYGLEYYDARTAMGGPGSVFEWKRQGLIAGDNLHMTARGARTFGAMLADRIDDSLNA